MHLSGGLAGDPLLRLGAAVSGALSRHWPERRVAHVRSTDAFEELKDKYTELQAHCRFLEARLQTVATAANLLALENAALSGQALDEGKVRVLPRRGTHMP